MAGYCAELAKEAAADNASEEMKAAAPRLEFMRQNSGRIAHDFKIAMRVS